MNKVGEDLCIDDAQAEIDVREAGRFSAVVRKQRLARYAGISCPWHALLRVILRQHATIRFLR